MVATSQPWLFLSCLYILSGLHDLVSLSFTVPFSVDILPWQPPLPSGACILTILASAWPPHLIACVFVSSIAPGEEEEGREGEGGRKEEGRKRKRRMKGLDSGRDVPCAAGRYFTTTSCALRSGTPSHPLYLEQMAVAALPAALCRPRAILRRAAAPQNKIAPIEVRAAPVFCQHLRCRYGALLRAMSGMAFLGDAHLLSVTYPITSSMACSIL